MQNVNLSFSVHELTLDELYDLKQNALRKTTKTDWALNVLDNFNNSRCIAWEVLTDPSGIEVRMLNKNATDNLSNILRTSMKRNRPEYLENIKVSVRNGRVFIYKIKELER